MNYSDQQLQVIQEYASAYLTISDIAIVLDIPADILREDIRDSESPAARAYRKGKILSKVRIHAQEMKLAFIGSPLAIENAHRNLMDMEDDE